MSRSLAFSFAFASALVAVVACEAESPAPGSSPASADGGPGEPGASGGEGGAEGGAAQDVPHALGTIVLGESHSSGKSDSTPLVLASFVPDAARVQRCVEVVSGCEILAAPKCDEEESVTGCKPDAMCTFDASCTPSCTPIPRCDALCEDDEACVLLDATKGPEGRCEKAPAFDAGPLAFHGTTTAITLFPPYGYEGESKGAPFLGGGELRVQAQGAVGAGFEAFDEKYTATTFIQTSPSLAKLPRDQVFGKGALTVKWIGGKDSVVITASGPGGSASCVADDSKGTFDVPRAVLDRVTKGSESATPTVTLSASRERRETKKGLATKGELPGVTIQREGWLDLVTRSTETASLQGCSGGAAACGDECVDLMTDPNHCGACGKECSGATAGCVAGKCSAVCAKGPETTLAACSDGCSNDGDNYVDCNDFDCCDVRKDCPANTACGKTP